jgi:signal transduction histidine kinase
VLFSLSLNLEAAGSLIERKPDRSAVLINRSQEIAAEALAEMRSLIFELRPAALQEKGLAMALTNLVNLFRRRQGIDVALAIDVEDRLPPEVEFCLYRVAQEALNNVSKHAKAQTVQVSYTYDQTHFIMRISDDGEGFDPAAQSGTQSFGMLGMLERLAPLHGDLRVDSAPGKGTVIEARIPIHPRGDAA